MVYLGRVVGVGLTKEGHPMAVYAISGRSPGSQARKLIFDSAELAIKTAKFIPSHFNADDREKCEVMWAEQEEYLLYNATNRTSSKILTVSNGYQTDMIAEGISDFDGPRESMNKMMEGVLFKEGPEHDPSSTPRIAGIVDPFEGVYFALGIVTKEGARAVEVKTRPGQVKLVATYQNNPSTEPLVGPELDSLGAVDLEMEGITPLDLAEEFMGWLDSQKDGKVEVISSAGMVYDYNTGWGFKPKNLWGD